ncbi:MAG: aconitate hydratase AcnA [Candidatus Marsarchaeota archaeon]|nr:aconitate hydratase AcnA [Candidatus Marsarchaeota archaeon]
MQSEHSAQGSNQASSNSRHLSSFKLASGKEIFFYSLKSLESEGAGKLSQLPFSIRVVMESLLRNLDGKAIKEEDIISLANWDAKNPADKEIPFKVSRVLMQDFTGVPAVVDLASMRDFMADKNIDVEKIQPIMPVDLIIDHSVQVDYFNVISAISLNQEKEIERNKERYVLLKWASNGFKNFRVMPPSAGICHQVNLEYIATCVSLKDIDGRSIAYPDTLVGTDSHTTMVNGLGVLGFGVGGIEAEAALLNQPVSFITPKVLGVHLKGHMNEGVTATDFALTLTRMLREKKVVNMFVEFFGEGIKHLSLPDRATLSNMCPEYGATIAIFPPDEETLNYLKSTGRSAEQIELVRRYYENQGMFEIDYAKVIYTDVLEVDLGSIVPSISGPSQPKEQLPLDAVRNNFINMFLSKDSSIQPDHKINSKDYTRWSSESQGPGNGAIKDAPMHESQKSTIIKYADYEVKLSDGDIVIAAITSCTNTSNPSVMIGAGLLAKKAIEKGLKVDTRKVKTSLAPGSRVVTDYLKKAGLMEPLEKLGFDLVGYGCTTCIGNSGPLIDKQSDAINGNGLDVAAVLSGNRNYEARIHRDVRANYLMSPPLVVAYAIAGNVMKDLTKDPIGVASDGTPVYLKDVWPSDAEIKKMTNEYVSISMFHDEYGSKMYDVNKYWNAIDSPSGAIFKWDETSTYIRKPPFFDGLELKNVQSPIKDISRAKILAVFGDSVSTDHISPAGAIGKDSPAGKYLIEKGVEQKDFNTYGARRGNHEVMMRGTFANNRIKNLMLNGKEGGYTIYYPDGDEMPIYEAAIKYKKMGIPLVVFGGIEYGSGSSRDWAAKGPALIGVKAVIAKSFERIHRSNLIGMGILPIQFNGKDDAKSLAIDYGKEITIKLPSSMKPRDTLEMLYYDSKDSAQKSVSLKSRIDTDMEMEYFKAGGILNYVLKNIAYES